MFSTSTSAEMVRMTAPCICSQRASKLAVQIKHGRASKAADSADDADSTGKVGRSRQGSNQAVCESFRGGGDQDEKRGDMRWVVQRKSGITLIDAVIPLSDDTDDQPGDLLGSWRHAYEDWARVKFVMDPRCQWRRGVWRQTVPSESRQEQTEREVHFSISTQGELLLVVTTDSSGATHVFSRSSDVSPLLASVLANGEMCNRLIVGKGGGVIKSLARIVKLCVRAEKG